MKRIVLCITLLCSPLSAWAGTYWIFYSGSEYMQLAEEIDYAQMLYVAGMSDGLNLAGYDMTSDKGNTFVQCTRGRKPEQLVAIFNKWEAVCLYQSTQGVCKESSQC